MAQIIVRLSDLLPPFRDSIELARIDGGWDERRLSAAVANHFGFLGAFTSAEIHLREREHDTADEEYLVLDFSPPPERDLAAAARRFKKATRDAEAGRVQAALPELARLAEEFPEVAEYHRALGQAFLVTDDLGRAEDSTLRSLSLNPLDVNALTLLGNLYVRQKRHRDAVPLYERSLALERNLYALNNLGAVQAELGDIPQALATLREASQLDPKYPNTWFGIGLALSRLEDLSRLTEAIAALDKCLSLIGTRDRSPEIWDAARALLGDLVQIEAREEVPRAQDAVRTALVDLTVHQHEEIRIEEETLRGVLAKIELAWVHERSYHRLVVGTSPGPEREHHILHELQHLYLMRAARDAGTNLWFASTAASREVAIRSMGAEITRIAAIGYPAAAVTEMTLGSIDGLLGQLFNFPLDLFIEARLQERYPQYRELFYVSIKSQLETASSIAHDARLKAATPNQIFRANAAMNGAYALWFEDRYPRRTDLLSRFKQTDTWPIARKLYTVWLHDSKRWEPGAEYKWIDSWAGFLGLRDWYEWRDGNPTS